MQTGLIVVVLLVLGVLMCGGLLKTPMKGRKSKGGKQVKYSNAVLLLGAILFGGLVYNEYM